MIESGFKVGFKGGLPCGYWFVSDLCRTHVVPGWAVPLSVSDIRGACMSAIELGLAVLKL